MRWKSQRRSSNVEDRRGQSPAYAAGGGGGGLLMLARFLPMVLRSKTGRTLLIIGVVMVIGAQFMGIDVLSLLTGQTAGPTVSSRIY